jgi:hypothetical protein
VSVKKVAVITLLACSLGGCASVPLATGIAIGSLVVAGTTLGLNAYHDCRQDGGCKIVKPPK